MKIKISVKAKSMLETSGALGEKFLRILVKPGGCAGMTYDAVIDDKDMGGDVLVYQEGDLRIVSDPVSAGFLDGLNIDYSDDLIQSGFKFSNSTCGGSCGCGASFETSIEENM